MVRRRRQSAPDAGLSLCISILSNSQFEIKLAHYASHSRFAQTFLYLPCLIKNCDAMKRIFIVAFAILLLQTACNADGRKEVVAVQDIPVAGRRILSDCFSGSNVSVVLKETELFEVEYEVRFDDGMEIVFDEDGCWKNIDCRKAAVPEELVPAQIMAAVRASFPGNVIVEIEKDGSGYDVELGNGLDLSFDRKYRMTIDD